MNEWIEVQAKAVCLQAMGSMAWPQSIFTKSYTPMIYVMIVQFLLHTFYFNSISIFSLIHCWCCCIDLLQCWSTTDHEVFDWQKHCCGVFCVCVCVCVCMCVCVCICMTSQLVVFLVWYLPRWQSINYWLSIIPIELHNSKPKLLCFIHL